MKHSNNLQYSRKLRQFRSLSKKINHLLATEKFHEMGSSVRDRLLQRLRHLFRLLSKPFSRAGLRRTLAAASLLLGLGTGSQAFSQTINFVGPAQNPYGLTPSPNYLNLPEAVDLDADGDLDLMAGTAYGVLEYYENIGSATVPAFAPPVTLPFGLDSSQTYLSFPALADLDGDGDIDMIAGEQYGVLNYFENVGDSANPAFAQVVSNPFGLDSADYISIPEIVDLDGDGDFDLLVGEDYGNWAYFENTGTATAPNFAAAVPNPFGITQAYYYGLPTAQDLDGDGDFDLLAGVYYGDLVYYENTGTATAPAFAAPVSNPYGLQSAYGIGYPTLCDLDGDSDFDVLIGESYGNFQYYKQDTFMVSIDPGTPLQRTMTIFPNPAVEQIHIEVETGEVSGQAELLVLNLWGKVVERQNIEITGKQLSFPLNIENLSAGAYIARLNVNGKAYRRRFVKQ